MRYDINQETEKRMMEYLDRERINTDIRDGIAGPFSSGYVFDREQLLMCAQALRADLKEQGKNLDEDRSVMAMMIIDSVTEAFGIEGEEFPIPDPVMDRIIDYSRLFHEGEFGDDPYLQNISVGEAEKNGFALTHGAYEPYEPFQYDTPVSEFGGILIPRTGAFTYRQEYPCITENGSAWMSVTPNEINTMKEPVRKASGKVLTLGLGMGYYTYMVSLKDDVESITVVEKSRDVIDLFNEYILPQFSHPEKVTVICDDAFKYIDSIKDGEFDFCFADIWKGNNDILPYLELKIACDRFEKMEVCYWIEDALSASVMGYVFVSMLEDFCAEKGIRLPDTQSLPEEEEFKLGFVTGLLMEKSVETAEDVDYYMNYDNICTLL